MIKTSALWLAKHLPRGWSRILFWAAKRYPELSRYRVSLKLAPETTFFADLNQSVCLPLFKWGCYPHQMIEDALAPTLLRKGEVVFDVGANIGYTAALFGRAVGSLGHVYAFEPARSCIGLLQENAAFLKNVTVVEAGVSEKSGVLLFEEQIALDTSRILLEQTAGEHPVGVYSVPVVSLDEFVTSGDRRHPHFVKVDVEGHEPAVFRGAARLLRETQPILLFEALGEDSFRDCVSTLKSVAPGVYRICVFSNGSQLGEEGEATRSHVNNYLAVPAWASERITPFLSRTSVEGEHADANSGASPCT